MLRGDNQNQRNLWAGPSYWDRLRNATHKQEEA